MGDLVVRMGRLLRWLARHAHGLYVGTGLLLSAGLVLALLGLWGLSGLTEGVLEGDTVEFDRQLLLWLDSRATPWLDRAALEVTALGDTIVVIVLASVSATLLWLLGRREYALLLIVGIGGAAIINPVLKIIFDRPRPQVFEWRAHFELTTHAYPSGHATISMVSFATLAFIIHRLAQRKRVSIAAAMLAATAILLVGISRLYLGVHYPSDVLAGYVVGFAWAVLCAVTVEALQRGRSRT